MNSPFAKIMRTAVEATPGAVGGAFAADDGETVDSFATKDQEEWAIFTAHYGVLLKYVQSAFNVYHYGEAEFMVVSHSEIDVLVHSVSDGYYALMAVHSPAPLGIAMQHLETAANLLRAEMA
jgi:hypothetical protein